MYCFCEGFWDEIYIEIGGLSVKYLRTVGGPHPISERTD